MKEILILFRNLIILLLTLLSFILFDRALNAGSENILINEVLFDPIGSDLGYEWIEIYNPNSFDILINNWKIQIAGSEFKDAGIFSFQLPSKSYLLICEEKVEDCDIYLPKLGFQNGGGATDGVQILDNLGNIIDQVFYDKPNTNNLTGQDRTTINNNQTALLGISGESIGRYLFRDTDNSFSDFYIYSSPTPGNENISPPISELPQTGETPIYILLFIIFLFSAMLYSSLKLFILSNGKSY